MFRDKKKILLKFQGHCISGKLVKANIWLHVWWVEMCPARPVSDLNISLFRKKNPGVFVVSKPIALKPDTG